MARVPATLVALMLLVAACGGTASSDREEGADQTQPPATQAAADDGGADATTPPPAPAPDTGDADEGSGPSTATVTLGDQTYTFSSEGAVAAQCLTDMFGLVSVQLPMVDDSGAPADGRVEIIVLHEDTDPDVVGEVNAVEVAVGDEDWVADEASMMFEQSALLLPGMSQVDSVEIDGRTVRGTATFFRQLSLFGGGQVDTVTGTFEATCGEERTS